ncbi:MAG: response regulator [Thermodesulfobacteriota bacterium]
MKVMIIDDERDTRVYLMAVLEDNGYQACALDANQDVTGGILKNGPDLIVLDIMMPRRSGISVYREIRSEPRFSHIPVIIISGMSQAGTFLETEFNQLAGDDAAEKPDGFIEKPVRLAEFLDLVETTLKKRGPYGPHAE